MITAMLCWVAFATNSPEIKVTTCVYVRFGLEAEHWYELFSTKLPTRGYTTSRWCLASTEEICNKHAAKGDEK